MATIGLRGLTGGLARRTPPRRPLTYPWSESGKAPDTTVLSRGVPAAPPAPTPPPIDPAYEAALAAAGRRRDFTLGQIDYQQGQLGQAYGYSADQFGNVTPDLSNPYSRAALLQQSYDRQKAATTNSMAAAGHLYSGALNNRRSFDATNNDVSRDALIREFLDRRQSLNAQRTAAQIGYADQTAQAKSDSLTRALANRPDAASVPAATPVTATAPPRPKVVTKKLAKPKRKKR